MDLFILPEINIFSFSNEYFINFELTVFSELYVLVRACTCAAVRAKKTKKLSNHVPETTTTQAVPSLSRGRMCVAVRAK